MFSSNWRYLYVITVITHCFYTHYIFKYFIESPRWLHSKGFKEECVQAITELAIFNGTEKQWFDFKNKNEELINKIGTPYLDKEGSTNDKIKNEKLKDKNYTIIDILRFKSQRSNFIKIGWLSNI